MMIDRAIDKLQRLKQDIDDGRVILNDARCDERMQSDTADTRGYDSLIIDIDFIRVDKPNEEYKILIFCFDKRDAVHSAAKLRECLADKEPKNISDTELKCDNVTYEFISVKCGIPDGIWVDRCYKSDKLIATGSRDANDRALTWASTITTPHADITGLCRHRLCGFS